MTALVYSFDCAEIEAARLLAQADPLLLASALGQFPVSVDGVLDALSYGAYAITQQDAEREQERANTLAAQAFDGSQNGLSPDTKRRREARARRISRQQATIARHSHPRALQLEAQAAAIVQASKQRRARKVDNRAEVEAFQRALFGSAGEVADGGVIANDDCVEPTAWLWG